MREHLISSFKVSLEWRIIAFIVTYAFLILTTGEFWTATWTSLSLQLILFIVHFVWVLLRYAKHGLSNR